MKTSKPISTISYNTEEFLRKKIEYWKDHGFIEYGMWIKHEPEQDEKKSHYHVFLRPAKLIQTMDLENDSIEIDPNNIDKPLKMVGFRNSKEDDWVEYAIHDEEYLQSKGLTREKHYSFDDIQTTDQDTLTDIISHLKDNRKGRLEYRLLDCIKRDMTWQQIVASGIIPLRQIAGAKIMYEAITGQSKLY